MDSLKEFAVTKLDGAVATATAAAADKAAKDFGAMLPRSVMAVLDVIGVTGAAKTLDVIIKGTKDGITWEVAATFSQKTAAGIDRLDVGDYRQYRANVAIGGTFAVNEVLAYAIYLVAGEPAYRPATQVA